MSGHAKIATLDDLLRTVPGLRKFRQLNAAMLRQLLDREPRTCTWCGEPVAKHRSTWCGDQCVEEFKSRCEPGHQARLVLKRDSGRCAVCGRDTIAAERDGKVVVKEIQRLHYGPADERERRAAELAQRLHDEFGYARGQWREVDHILPVSEGGGLLGIGNLRLVCGACHLRATNELVQRKVK